VPAAKRRAYRDILRACGGDRELADDVIAGFVGENPSLADLRAVAERAREIAAEIEAEEE